MGPNLLSLFPDSIRNSTNLEEGFSYEPGLKMSFVMAYCGTELFVSSCVCVCMRRSSRTRRRREDLEKFPPPSAFVPSPWGNGPQNRAAIEGGEADGFEVRGRVSQRDKGQTPL